VHTIDVLSFLYMPSHTLDQCSGGVTFGFLTTALFCVWCAGLCRLPALSRLTELDCLAASFNNISSLPHLVPVDAAAVAAAATAAADNGSSTSDTGDIAAVGSAAAGVAAQLDKLLVSKVPSALPGCLTQLGLAYNQLECLPLELPAALPQLTSLDLSHNRHVQVEEDGANFLFTNTDQRLPEVVLLAAATSCKLCLRR
jgi:hypothetical protein